MSDKPLYYGGKNSSSPVYYGSSKPVYYGAGASRNYGSAAYYGGAYGGMYGGSSGDDADGSVIGKVTMARMLRVISQRWLSVFVFFIVGLIVSFTFYRVAPTIYEATSEFSMDMRRFSGGHGQGGLADITPDYGSTYAEVFNTRISDWRSEKIVAKIIQQYRASRPNSTVSDETLVEVLAGSELELKRNSRIITIAVRAKSPELCADLANAYAASIESFTDEENKIRCDKAVAQIHQNVERKRREADKISKRRLDFRSSNKVDNLTASRDTIQQGLSKTTADILALETEETQLIEWEKMLAAVQKDPASYGNLSTSVPRAQEIAEEFKAFQDASGKYQQLMLSYTESHPEVKAAKSILELARQRFLDAAARALLTGRATLRVARSQLAILRQKQESLGAELASVEQRIVLAESGLAQLDAEFEISNRVLEGLIIEENKARIEAESNNEIVRVGRQATVPTKPVFPNPTIVFGVGIILSFGLGVLFVLVIDNLEDTVVNLTDIEQRLALKVLAVLPHVRRKKREEVARHLLEDRYSQFSEAVAGLRNLLDSPRYEALSHCLLLISTQPGEGKTITSTSLAIAYAQAGRRTLHVDFDLRRPRLATIWGMKLDEAHSFSHVLQSTASGGAMPDFAALVHHTDVQGLDVIASLPPEGVSPATIFGLAVVPEFFKWARANYDHIVVDAPPYGLVGDVVSLSTLVDSVLVMCCPDRTRFRPIQACTRSLTEAGASILGVVVNDIEVSSARAFSTHGQRHYGKYGGYGYGYGYGYGEGGYRPKKSAKDKKGGKDAKDGNASAAPAGPNAGKDAGKPKVDSPSTKEFSDDD